MIGPSPSRQWLTVFSAGFLVIGLLLVVTLFTPAPYGDLSRTGLVSEAQFGWTQPQPRVPESALVSSPIEQADVLVIGDSFSMSRYWQSVLVRDGMRVATASWGQVGNALCRDFDDWIARAGFRGSIVVVESVERMARQRVLASANCARMAPDAAPTQPAPFHPPPSPPDGLGLNWDARLMSGWATWWNTRRALKAVGAVAVAANTVVRPVPGGCEVFSHRACDRALFFDEDVSKGPLSDEDLRRVGAVSAATRLPLLWMVVPNKTTAYVDAVHSAAFGKGLQAAGLGPDLFAFVQLQRSRVVDFYYSNDTHLSLQGELILGERMRDAIRDRWAASRPKTAP